MSHSFKQFKQGFQLLIIYYQIETIGYIVIDIIPLIYKFIVFILMLKVEKKNLALLKVFTS